MMTKRKPSDWIDPDDVPHWTGKEFSDGTWHIGEREVAPAEARTEVRRRGRPPGTGCKESTTVRFDREVLEAFRAGGPGWQTRMNDALREWLRTHPERR